MYLQPRKRRQQTMYTRIDAKRAVEERKKANVKEEGNDHGETDDTITIMIMANVKAVRIVSVKKKQDSKSDEWQGLALS